MPPETHRTEPQRHQYGVLDIGSNSVRFVIYEIYGAAFTPIYDEKVLAGLGRDLRRSGKLHAGGKVRALAALKRFALLIRLKGLENFLSIAATAALRDALDAPEFIQQVRAETGLDITPLSGPEEAKCAAMGVIANEPRACGLVADLGGASLELTPVDGGQAGAGVSYRLGPFAMYEGAFEVNALRPKIRAELGRNWATTYAGHKRLYLVGGAWRNLANIFQKRTGYPLRLTQNYQISRKDAQNLAAWAISPDGVEALLSWPNVTPRRAETLPYSGLVLGMLLDGLAVEQVVIAPGGLREGLVYEALVDKQGRNALLDACSGLVVRTQSGAEMGYAIYSFIKPCQPFADEGLGAENARRLLQAACQLSGVGLGLHPGHRAQIVYEIALYGPLSGLTHKERAWLALCLFRSFRSSKSPPKSDVIDYLLDGGEKNSAALCGEAIRAAIVLSSRSPNALLACRLKTDEDALILETTPEQAALLIERPQSHFETLACLMGKSFRMMETLEQLC